MSGILAGICCCGMPYTCLNGSVSGCITLCASSLPNGITYITSSGLAGILSLCGSTCAALAGVVSGLLGGMLGGGGGGVANALPAVMQNAGGGK